MVLSWQQTLIIAAVLPGLRADDGNATRNVEMLLASCQEHHRLYMETCYQKTYSRLDNIWFDTPPDEGCDHRRYACLHGGATGDACRQECPLAVAFALFGLFIELLQAGELEDARRILLYLLYHRSLLPPSCQGDFSQGGCKPILPVGYFVGAQESLQMAIGELSRKEIRYYPESERRLVTGRSIAVVTAHHVSNVAWRLRSQSNSSTGSLAAMMPWYVENKRCYAFKHGYHFVFDRRSPDVDLQSGVDGYKWGIHWTKLSAVRRALKKYDWVFWIDYDALFSNMTMTLDEIIDLVESHSGADLIVQNGWDLVNPNAFLLRSSSWSFRFLETWEKFGRQVVRGRSKMWELRCFNCAVVQQIMVAATGTGLRGCGEAESHVLMLRHLLEKFGFDYSNRQQKVSVGRIYFWDPTAKFYQGKPRGLLFHVNDREQQIHFNEFELYSPGDLAIHWPTRDKDTTVMRDFANAVPGADGCQKWLQPRVDLRAVYHPLGVDAAAPALYSAEHVLVAAARLIEVGSVAVRTITENNVALIEAMLTAMPQVFRFDVLIGREATEEDKAAWSPHKNVKIRGWSTLGQLPATKLYDFIFIGIDVDGCDAGPCQKEASREYREALARVRPGGLMAMPLDGCGSVPETSRRYAPPHNWRLTRFPGQLDCLWGYATKMVTSEDNYNIWKSNQEAGP
eukprot:TRINITY_DN12623_c0_g1_i1.p1 TRINITY_DN12623_c0_g1~~TRINITY_DN12623_c0_g1_i1.p1  ORF type:complete len:682 (+),score=110.42 TRINITY_DN12623_c0_g1_i1:186-2231(+)